jgi:hypothetical protein
MLRYVQTRYLNPDDGHKYDNPASRLGTNPRLAWTLTTQPPRPGLLVVCEGIPDALTAAQHGYQAVGVLGAQAPDLRVAVHLARRATSEHRHLVAIIDHDAAGHTWGRRLAELLAEHDQPFTVIQPPTPGMDLNAWGLEDSTWTRRLHDAVASLGHDATPTAPRARPAVDPLDVIVQP